ncbi:hypothetical protein MesoLjLc_51810 [Mesorhizobium sp. L-8-10]|uniref:hypothetical protein n=1 Tax=Mesorhizobium sp. L-8-10 TaxID=2744523 RepID=UPI001926A7B2|nr:hypothetical protein [Mesorhizobium sp. L-8-10]BCH33251.1 hypothetical protein MesoLjLc_51810 [Mesorhizobium sp. L-8-10]
MSIQGDKWKAFSDQVLNHIEEYVIPQYGDEGADLVTDYSPEECLRQTEKYIKRFGRSSRQGEELRDLIKAAHFIQRAADKLRGSA